MTDFDDAERSEQQTWTAKYRVPIAAVSGVLALVCLWLLITASTPLRWLGGVGLAVLVVWVLVFRALYKRGY